LAHPQQQQAVARSTMSLSIAAGGRGPRGPSFMTVPTTHLAASAGTRCSSIPLSSAPSSPTDDACIPLCGAGGFSSIGDIPELELPACLEAELDELTAYAYSSEIPTSATQWQLFGSEQSVDFKEFMWSLTEGTFTRGNADACPTLSSALRLCRYAIFCGVKFNFRTAAGVGLGAFCLAAKAFTDSAPTNLDLSVMAGVQVETVGMLEISMLKTINFSFFKDAVLPPIIPTYPRSAPLFPVSSEFFS